MAPLPDSTDLQKRPRTDHGARFSGFAPARPASAQTKDATSGFAKPFTIEVIGDVKDPPAPGDIISYVGMKAGSFTTNNTGTITWASSPEITMPVAYQNKCEVDWGIPEPSGGWYGQLSQAPGTSASPGPRNSLSMIETLQRRTGGAAFDGIIAAGFNVSLKVFVPADDGDDLNNSQSYVLVGAFGAIEWVSKEGEWQVQRTASGTYNVTYLGGPIQPRQVYGTVQDTIGVAISIDTLDEAAGTFRVRTYGAGLTSPGDLRFALQVIKV